MDFSLVVFIILASVASIGSRRSPAPLLANYRNQLPQCQQFFNRVEKFENCDIPSRDPAVYTKDALPYICLLTSNLIIDICKGNDSGLYESFEAHYKAHVNRTVCPFSYATKNNNITVNMDNAIKYFSIEDNCENVCHFSKQTMDDCIVMASLNDWVKTMNKRDEEVTVPRQQNFTKIINASSNDKMNKSHPARSMTKAENPITEHNESSIKSENKATAKIETTSGCQTKEIKEEINNEKVDTQPKDKDIHRNNINANSNTKLINNDEIDKINDNGDNNNNNNDNIPKKNNNEEGEERVSQDALNEDKSDLLQADVPPIKINDPSLQTSTSAKKDFTTNKVSLDEGGDDDTNEEILENVQQQDMLHDRDYDSVRVRNPKELYNGGGLFQAEDSHFSVYFLMTVSIIIIGYIIYHNKNKIVAYALEGRRSRNGRRRPTPASYRKLDCNLEEAIASNPSHASVTNVVY